jgi:hypothetical protein
MISCYHTVVGTSCGAGVISAIENRMVLDARKRVMQFLFNAARSIISSLPIFKFKKGLPICFCRWSVSTVLYLSCSSGLYRDRRKITLRENKITS